MGSVKCTGSMQLTPAENECLWRDLYRGLSIKKILILQVPKETVLFLLFLQVPFIWTEMRQVKTWRILKKFYFYFHQMKRKFSLRNNLCLEIHFA